MILALFLGQSGYYVLRQGETLPVALKAMSVADTVANKIIDAIGEKLNLRKCRTGDLMFVTQREGQFIELKYEGPKTTVIVDSLFQVSELGVRREFVCLNGVVTNGSLWDAVVSAGGTPALVYTIADEIFSSDIDFNVETNNGDEFKLLTYAEYSGNRFIGYGKILFATYISNKKEYIGIYYDKTPHPGYYNLDGKSLRKLFLRSPVSYIRISSGFTKARFHPILRVWRPHLGIDYAAPTGTPVRTIGDGIVLSAGWNKGYGKQVIIQHSQGFKSYYGHLSSVLTNAGKFVKQGDLIGRVGMTGLATGPHLDFKLQKYGEFVNPIKIIPPPVQPLIGKQLEEYKEYTNNLITLTDAIKAINKIPLLKIE